MSGQPYAEPALTGPTAPAASVTADVGGGKTDEKHIEQNQGVHAPMAGVDLDGVGMDPIHHNGAIIEQTSAIPKTGKRIPTGKWEYIMFTIYCECRVCLREAAADGSRQTLPTTVLPSAVTVVPCVKHWHPKPIPNPHRIPTATSTGVANSFPSTVCCSTSAVSCSPFRPSSCLWWVRSSCDSADRQIGPFADYGNWRPFILTTAQVVLWIMQFALVGISDPNKWQIANGLYVVGSLASNISVAFYQATL